MNSVRKIAIFISLFFISINGLIGQDCTGQSTNVTWDFQIVSTPLFPGDNFFIECYVTGFVDILTFQYTITYNPNVLEFSSVDNLGSELIGPVEVNSTPATLATGSIATIWTNGNGEPQTVADGPIFKIFLEVIGDPGDCSDWLITSNVVEFEVAWELPDGTLCTETVNIDQQLSGGELCIECGNDISLITNACGGNLELSACGGSGPYTYTLEGPGGTVGFGTIDEGDVESFTGLPGGLYFVTMMDAGGQTLPISQGQFDLVDSDPLTIDVSIINNIACANGDGDLLASAEGGVPPYTFEWSNGLFSENASNLTTGDYVVTVTDDNGCTAESALVTLGVTPLVVADLQVTPATCLGSADGQVIIQVTGGTPINGTDYLYDGFGQGPIATYENVNPGMLTINIFDEPGCFIPVDVVIPAASTGDYQIINEVPIECFGDFAQLEIMADIYEPSTTPGILDSLPSIVDQNPQNTNDDLTSVHPVTGNINFLTNTPGPGNMPGLEAGDYLISFYTIDGCFVEIPYVVTGAPEISITIDSQIDPDCDGNPGEIEVSIGGGVGALTPTWNMGGPGLSFEVTEGGTYTLVVTDANMCSDSISIDIADAGSLGLMTEVVDEVGCGAAADSGSVEATISGTGTNITYNWENSNGDVVGDTPFVDGLGVGTYFVTVTDEDMACSQQGEVTIDGAGTFFFNPDITPLTCFGGSDAEIEMAVTGGTGPFMYAWSHDSNLSFNFASNLSGGSYTVTITDSDQCELDTTIVIENPDQMQINVDDVVGVSCYNGADGSATSIATNSSIGATEFTYFWGDAAEDSLITSIFADVGEISELTSGELFAYAFDGQCFSDTVYFDLPNADEILIDSVNTFIQNPPCATTAEGAIEVVVFGGTSSGTYDYNWDNGESGNVLTDLQAGDYTVFVTDDNDCEVEFDFELEQPDSLFLFLNDGQTSGVSCFGDSTAIIGTFASGGTGTDYTYTWMPDVATTNVAQNVGPGDYTIIVSDELGCTASLDYEVLSSIPLEVNLLPIDSIPCNAGTTQICLEASGGTGFGFNYQINFSDNIPIDSCFTTTAGEFEINVTDSEGCAYEETLSFPISQPDPISIDLSNGMDLEIGEGLILELGDTSLVLDPIITGPNAIDTYVWSSESDDWDCVDPDICESINVFPTSPAIFALEVTDIFGCTANADILIDIKTERNFFAPNIFTPDMDGNNELFHPFTGKGVTMIKEWVIYDRWGNVVYAAENIKPGDEILYAWDGRFGNLEAVPGVYVYIAEVEFIDDVVQFFRGSVTLVR